MSDFVSTTTLTHMTSEALRVDLAKLHAQLDFLGAFREGDAVPAAVDGLPARLVADYEALSAEFERRSAAAA